MTSISSRIVAVAATFAVAVVLPACSSSQDHAEHPTSTTTSVTVAAHNADDVMFAQMMIPHHQQALELSALVPDRSSNPAVVDLAAKIAAEQQPEINTMKALLLQWDVDPNAAADHGGHGMGMAGMVDDATMTRLDSLKGPDFDTLWLQSMIGHHQGAIEMAKAEVANGQSADMTTLAKSIITAQQAEIDQMKQMLGG
ncbi:DUF305 domain-containing protein [Mycolicibacterium litorale]|nr:DUF305 domain-containing protein [Mycolicibacterium litorale]